MSLPTQNTDESALTEVAATIHQWINAPIITFGGTDVTLVMIVVVGIMIVVTWWVSHLLQRTVERAFRARGIDDLGTVAVSKRLLHYAVMAIGLALAIQQIGINLSALFAAGALFAVGIGFAMQNIAQNFVSGLILLVERPIKPGDVVEVEDRVVRVLKMGIRTTVARTRDEEAIIIPNSSLVQTPVKNFTLGDSVYRIRANVGVTYDSDMRRVRSALERAAKGVPWRLQEHDPVFTMTGFGDSSVDWQASVWIDDPWRSKRLLSDLLEAVWWALKEDGIVIAFPQLDLHLDPPVEQALAGLSRAG
jgi:small-conductance mechanosensitive channel